MSKYYFQVERAGAHSTFQDLGRFNVQHLGICPGGPMDSNLLKISNKLVNNSLHTGVMEFAYQGPRLKLISGTTLAMIMPFIFSIFRPLRANNCDNQTAYSSAVRLTLVDVRQLPIH